MAGFGTRPGATFPKSPRCLARIQLFTIATMEKLLVTGSSGLIGSEVVAHFARLGWQVHGVDNNLRADFFGPEGDTRWNQRRLCEAHPASPHASSTSATATASSTLADAAPDLIVHAAAQPSHDLAASRPFDDFDVNAVGTLNLLEATRRHAPEAVFVHMSTNKVYGDAPTAIPLKELETRWDYADPAYAGGIAETSPSTRASTASSGPPRSPPTSWSRNTAATSA